MNVLVVGDWHSELHEEGVKRALLTLGHNAEAFPWFHYFKYDHGNFLLKPIRKVFKKAQNKYLLGPVIDRLNRDLIKKTEDSKPDIIFIYRGTHIRAATLRAIRRTWPDILLIGYNNDDPFSPHFPRWMWRHFLASVPEYDLVLAYRKHNLAELLRLGAKKVQLLRSWYMPERNYPVPLSEDEKQRFECDVVFVGHYEKDIRVEFLEAVAEKGWHLKIFGHGADWDPVLRNSSLLKNQIPVRLVWGDEYNKALNGAKIALCFFSKLNRDTYTRRCFEIPATGTLLLSEYSEDLASLFEEGKEADFFRDKDELIKKIDYYLTHEQQRRQVADAGLQRVRADGHDVVSRSRQLMLWANEIIGG